MKLSVLVLTEDQEPLGARALGLQLSHGIDGEGRACTLEFASVDHAAGFACQQRRQHRRAVVGVCHHPTGFLPRCTGRQPAQFVERELLRSSSTQREVRQVRRIEASTQQADARGCAQASPAQSRAGKKSL